MRAVLIDDEAQSRSALRATLSLLSYPVEIIGEAGSVASAVELIDQLQPELLFLDIHLGDGSGFDVLEQCKWKNLQVVFVTAYNQYALQAFKVNAQAYLLKPIEKSEVDAVLSRIVPQPEVPVSPHWAPLLQYIKNSYEKISFTGAEGIHLYTRDEIVRCEADNNYSRIFLQSGEELYVARTLKDLESQLHDSGFERIHKSHLINLQHLRKYLNRDGGSVLMSDGATLPVSQRKKPEMLQLLSRFK